VNAKMKIAYIVAPGDASGGGMGRVRDYIVQSPRDWWNGLVPTPLVTRGDGGKAQSMKLLFSAFVAIRRGKRDGTLALVHVNMGDGRSLLRKGLIVLECQRLRVPVFIHLHAVELAKLRRSTLKLLAWPFRAATAAVVLGDVYRRYLIEELGITETRIEILWNGVPVTPVEGRRHDAGGEVPFTIMFLGTLCERKGLSDLIAALALLPQEGRGWRAVFAGGGDIEGYRAKAAAAGIIERVEFAGWLEQGAARERLATVDLMVLPSYDEGLPLVILEALALGTPVIATPVGAIPEVLTDEKDILFVPPGDRARLRAAIVRAVSDAGLRQRLCDNGLAKFRRMFSIEAFCANLLAIWQRHLPPMPGE
jgi:glycosyltransferase involved in cell wall biosynthesis